MGQFFMQLAGTCSVRANADAARSCHFRTVGQWPIRQDAPSPFDHAVRSTRDVPARLEFVQDAINRVRGHAETFAADRARFDR